MNRPWQRLFYVKLNCYRLFHWRLGGLEKSFQKPLGYCFWNHGNQNPCKSAHCHRLVNLRNNPIWNLKLNEATATSKTFLWLGYILNLTAFHTSARSRIYQLSCFLIKYNLIYAWVYLLLYMECSRWTWSERKPKCPYLPRHLKSWKYIILTQLYPFQSLSSVFLGFLNIRIFQFSTFQKKQSVIF